MTTIAVPAGLERYTSKSGLLFDLRPDTSDIKAVREVVEKRGYGRYGFVPAEDEFWVDLGANVGAFSVWAAAQHPSITVHAYEPDPTMCELIEHNLKINKLSDQVTVYQSAVVADSRKTVTLHCNTARGNMWRNSIEREWRGGEDIVVDAYPFKKVLKAADNGSYIKMDIEGTEMPLLEWLLADEQQKLLDRKVQGMVFEWSFDVDPAIARFRRIVALLEGKYEYVRNTNVPTHNKAGEVVTDWPPQWFPAARLVWAWND